MHSFSICNNEVWTNSDSCIRVLIFSYNNNKFLALYIWYVFSLPTNKILSITETRRKQKKMVIVLCCDTCRKQRGQQRVETVPYRAEAAFLFICYHLPWEHTTPFQWG